MTFQIPEYKTPDFGSAQLCSAPDALFESCPADGIAPEDFHSTSLFPEYVKTGGEWLLAEDSRMDCCLVLKEGRLIAEELRKLKKGDMVLIGRSEDGSRGIYVNSCPFGDEGSGSDTFAFRRGRSRETGFSRDYDRLVSLLRYEKEHGGNVLWVTGPVVSFDDRARRAFSALIENGYVNGLMAGNALATHDLEGGLMHTALGQDIYTGELVHNGHYNHMDVINKVRSCGSIPQFIDKYGIDNGIIFSCVKNRVPFVLAGSIRDDGPLPEVTADVYESQDRMRDLIRSSTTVICMATMLHTIATGNMTPCFRVHNGVIRPLYIYTVDANEFAINKLSDRGSLSATGIVTNAQDFLETLATGLGLE